jgi:hypothetical protein
MAKKENAEVSITKLEKFCKQNDKVNTVCTFEVDGEAVEYSVKYRLSLEDCIKFVDDVVSGCIDKSEMTLIGIARSFLIKRNLMTFYANFRMPSDISKAYAYISGAESIINDIIDNIDAAQYASLLDDIDKGIEFEINKMTCEQETRINGVIEKLNGISEQMESIFGGISGEEASKFISTVASAGQIDAKDIADVFAQKVTNKQ